MMSDFVTRSPIDFARLADGVSGSGRGAATLFLGSVRRAAGDGEVVAIEYSGYEEMISAEFEKILGEAASKWPDGAFAAQHRLGKLPVGEASIVIAVSTPHRAESFDACRYIIEEVKKRLPVWKKEFFEDGSQEWRENEPFDSAD